MRHGFLLLGLVFLTSTSTVFAVDPCQFNTLFKTGVGIYDITGPAAEVGMMGYGMLNQQTAGIYQRLWARAFIIESSCNGKRVVIVNADLGQIFQGIKQGVIKKLAQAYGDLYNDDNVLMTANHTHSGPGGYSTYAFYNLSTLGFNRQNYDAIVNGIFAAIVRAHNNRQTTTLSYGEGEVLNLGHNRSPEAYHQNPEAERGRYSNNIDTNMQLIRFDNLLSKPLGLINWYPMHGVSLNNKNQLISGDNKGYAEYLFEQDYASDYGHTAFVAAFAQGHAGDVSPNVLDQEGGEGLAGLKAVERAALPQYSAAKQIFKEAKQKIMGGIDYRHTFVEMDKQYVVADQQVKMSCPAALGISMFAGTKDGEGVGEQGVTCETIVKKIPQFLCKTTRTQCQAEKPIALATGNFKPHPWTPQVLPFQLIKLGNVVIAAVPFEITTMTGRRLKQAIATHFPGQAVILATLANAYAGYVATREEYQLQRYEGASTHFGPATAEVIRANLELLAQKMVQNQPLPAGPIPADLTGFQLRFKPGVVYDTVPSGKKFGEVYQDVRSVYHAGEVVRATFWGAHPNNDLHSQASFVAVQKLIAGKWTTIKNDNSWETEFHWRRQGVAQSLATLVWRTTTQTPVGSYRIAYFGDAKSVVKAKPTPFVGYSSLFVLE